MENLTFKLFTNEEFNYSKIEFLNVVNRTSPGKGQTILDLNEGSLRNLEDTETTPLYAVMIK